MNQSTSTLTIDRRKGLTLYFYENENSIQFASESIQEFFFKKTDISDIQYFSFADIDGENIEKANHLLSQFHSFYDLMKIEQYELRFPLSFSEFKNGNSLNFDFNLTTIKAKDKYSLFCFTSLIFEEFNFNDNECQQVILNNPNHIIRLYKRNSQIHCSYKTQG